MWVIWLFRDELLNLQDLCWKSEICSHCFPMSLECSLIGSWAAFKEYPTKASFMFFYLWEAYLIQQQWNLRDVRQLWKPLWHRLKSNHFWLVTDLVWQCLLRLLADIIHTTKNESADQCLFSAVFHWINIMILDFMFLSAEKAVWMLKEMPAGLSVQPVQPLWCCWDSRWHSCHYLWFGALCELQPVSGVLLTAWLKGVRLHWLVFVTSQSCQGAAGAPTPL